MIEQAADASRQSGRAAAVAQHQYRAAKAGAYQMSSGTIKDRESATDLICEDQRLRAYLADADANADKQLLMSLRAQLSAFQTIINADRAELDLVKFNPSAVNLDREADEPQADSDVW